MPQLRIGIIGCGEVTQIIHLPTLYQLSDLLTVSAICDVSPRVLAGVGDAWNIRSRSTDYRELLSLDTVDAVLIANPNGFHPQTTLAALRAGKHVLVEKPLCLNLAENDAVITEQSRAGKVVQVGTMRRYAPAFIAACRQVSELKDIRAARVHDMIGRNSLVIEPTARVIRPDDIPAAASAAARQRDAEQIRLAIGDAPADLRSAYRLMLGLSTHDLSAMREMLGQPKRVLHATCRQGGRALTAAFDYGDFVCQFLTGVDEIPRYDSFIQVFGADKVIRVDYDTPYVRNLPIRLTVQESAAGVDNRRAVTHPGWGDAFAEEWRAFHRSVTLGEPVKASPRDFRHDLLLFKEMIQHMARSSDEPV